MGELDRGTYLAKNPNRFSVTAAVEIAPIVSNPCMMPPPPSSIAQGVVDTLPSSNLLLPLSQDSLRPRTGPRLDIEQGP